MTLEEWDEHIRPHLQRIEHHAYLCVHHVNEMVYRPAFQSMAADELEKAERVLTAALTKVRNARKQYEETPHEP